MEVTHPHPILEEILQTTEALLVRQPLFKRFREKLSIVKSGDGHALRIDSHGPGDFEFHAEMRLPHEHVWMDVPRSGSIEAFLRQSELAFVQLYDQHLGKKEQLAAPPAQVGEKVDLVEDLGPTHRPDAHVKLIRELTYSECIEAGCSEAEALDYVKTSKPPRVIYEAPSEPAPAPAPVAPPEADPEDDELWP